LAANFKTKIMKKVRMGLIALAVMISIGSAFGTRTALNHRDETEYSVTAQDDPTYYTVSTDLSGGCNLGPTKACHVLSDDSPDGMGRILKVDCTTSEVGIHHF
jgi:hypothetical protein